MDKLLYPYSNINNDQWADGVSQWHPAEFIHVLGGNSSHSVIVVSNVLLHQPDCSSWAHTVHYHDLCDGKHCPLRGLVNFSQRLNYQLHQAWVAVKKIRKYCYCTLFMHGWVCGHIR